MLASKVADFAVVHPDPGAGAAQDLCNFGGAEKHLAGVELGSAGADGCEGVAVEGFFAGHLCISLWLYPARCIMVGGRGVRRWTFGICGTL